MDPLLLNLPDELATDRLLLRIPRPGDGERVTASVRASLAELEPWMPWATDAYAVSDGEIWCRRNAGEFHLRAQLQYVILERETGEHVGNVGAFRFNWKNGTCEIGYWTRTDRTRRGYMTEAVTALTSMLYEQAGIRRIEIRCDDRNSASASVAIRCGYALDGTLREEFFDEKSGPRSTKIFSRIRPSPVSEVPGDRVQSA